MLLRLSGRILVARQIHHALIRHSVPMLHHAKVASVAAVATPGFKISFQFSCHHAHKEHKKKDGNAQNPSDKKILMAVAVKAFPPAFLFWMLGIIFLFFHKHKIYYLLFDNNTTFAALYVYIHNYEKEGYFGASRDAYGF